MTDDPLVEKVAQAIYATILEDEADWVEGTPEVRAMYYGYARAAINAISKRGNDGITRMIALAAKRDLPEGFTFEYRAVIHPPGQPQQPVPLTKWDRSERYARLRLGDWLSVDHRAGWIERRLVGPFERMEDVTLTVEVAQTGGSDA